MLNKTHGTKRIPMRDGGKSRYAGIGFWIRCRGNVQPHARLDVQSSTADAVGYSVKITPDAMSKMLIDINFLLS